MSDNDHVDVPGVVDVITPIDNLEHLGSRITLKLTEVLRHIFSFGESTLQGRKDRLCGYEARCSVDNDNVEIRFMSTMYTVAKGRF